MQKNDVKDSISENEWDIFTVTCGQNFGHFKRNPKETPIDDIIEFSKIQLSL